ncbi:MAG: DUF3011 domain-containing protein [Xanthomonadaceae bacterium]|jgi:hypothetical protein|nr:DUF3011 domain-containing protein [Xanthomonadaceae bacterium]
MSLRSRIQYLYLYLLTMMLMPAAMTARATDTAEYEDETVRCESQRGRWNHCPMDTRTDVSLVRQLSGNACIRGMHWGTDDYGIWVTGGCRGEFRARERAVPVKMRNIVRCESSMGRRTCAVALRGASVRLLRQLTDIPCRRDRSWGVGRNEIWVSKGCRGEFEISTPDGVFMMDARTIRCESKSRRRMFCGVTVSVGATLEEQLSKAPCRYGESWGWDRDGVWVDGGCRADFRIE